MKNMNQINKKYTVSKKLNDRTYKGAYSTVYAHFELISESGEVISWYHTDKNVHSSYNFKVGDVISGVALTYNNTSIKYDRCNINVL